MVGVEGGAVVDEPDAAVPDEQVGVVGRAVHVLEQRVQPDRLGRHLRVDLRPGGRLVGQRPGQEVEAQVQAGAGLQQVPDLGVGLGRPELGLDGEEGDHGHREARRARRSPRRSARPPAPAGPGRRRGTSGRRARRPRPPPARAATRPRGRATRSASRAPSRGRWSAPRSCARRLVGTLDRMRTVIVGGGMVGLTLARLLRAAGEDPVVLERMPAGGYQRRPFLLGFQGFPTLEELGLLERVRAEGWDIAPGLGRAARGRLHRGRPPARRAGGGGARAARHGRHRPRARRRPGHGRGGRGRRRSRPTWSWPATASARRCARWRASRPRSRRSRTRPSRS